jgi:hypothetical protein
MNDEVPEADPKGQEFADSLDVLDLRAANHWQRFVIYAPVTMANDHVGDDASLNALNEAPA